MGNTINLEGCLDDSPIARLQAAGVPCRALAAWCRCHDGHEDLCASCFLGDPETCDVKVIEALVNRVVNATGHVDEALSQRDYWKLLTSRLCDVIIERSKERQA